MFCPVIVKAQHVFYLTAAVWQVIISTSQAPPLCLFIHIFLRKFPSFHLFSLPNPPPAPLHLSSPQPALCHYHHPHASIFGCSSRPPANPLISSHLCLSRTISSTHSLIQYKCACMKSPTQYYTCAQPTPQILYNFSLSKFQKTLKRRRWSKNRKM